MVVQRSAGCSLDQHSGWQPPRAIPVQQPYMDGTWQQPLPHTVSELAAALASLPPCMRLKMRSVVGKMSASIMWSVSFCSKSLCVVRCGAVSVLHPICSFHLRFPRLWQRC